MLLTIIILSVILSARFIKLLDENISKSVILVLKKNDVFRCEIRRARPKNKGERRSC